MRGYSQAPEHFIKLQKPVVLSVSLRNKYNTLNPPQEDSVFIPPPSLTDIGLRPLLQKLQPPASDKVDLSLPNVTEIHKENFLSAYDSRIIDELIVGTPEFLWAELRNVHNSYIQREHTLELGLPNGIKIGGSVKPVLTSPVLKGTEDRHTVSNVLLWGSDASITHTGYTLYKSLEPIPVDTTQEPYKQLGRNVKQFFDYDDIPLNTTVYYRVTPTSVHGNFFSNQVELTHYDTDIGDADNLIFFMIQESPTYIPLRADNNIIPLVPVDTKWNELVARFEKLSVTDSALTSEYIPASSDIKLQIYVNTTNLIYFMMQESSTYTPLRVDNNIIPLVPAVNTAWDGLDARFEQMVVLDTDIVSEYTPTPLNIEMRTYDE